ncbi:glycosyltransferase family 2 protein [Hymenobacter jeollabukensis]|uniref:Glycosyltransferase family 2 protein n=1 Tax=Hymenobacter jeollabukensis TaxID=2025313 RepID=A0A5R8WRL0_9BACT|nr:glycosyltransferase family 2 protein [Hymenobacter jeollabukensis]
MPAADSGAPLLSVVSPVYGAAALLPELVRRIVAAVDGPTGGRFEIILVDDRSPDQAWPRIEAASRADARVRGVRLSRNFGQHRALAAGLAQSRGTWVAVLDCDLEDAPEAIPALWAAAQQPGCDYAVARREARQHGWGVRLTSKVFYRVLSTLTGVPQDDAVANFGVYHRRVIEAVGQLPERGRFFPVLVRWVGFEGTTLAVPHGTRPAGGSSYSFGRRLQLALDVLLAWSDKPLRLAILFGAFISAAATALGLITLVRYFIGSITVPGYTSLTLLLCFFFGLVIALIGLVGLYVGRTFEEARQRPLYLIDQLTPPAPPTGPPHEQS